jgi:phosphoserine phosphatase
MENKSKLKIAWDVDDTLIIPPCVNGTNIDIPRYDTIQLYKWFQDQGNYMIIWSGGGQDYARMWGEKLGLFANEYRDKGMGSKDLSIDICFDDCNVDLAKVNVKVNRVKNSVSRKADNERIKK